MADQIKTVENLATYTIDPAHSGVGFTVAHMGFARVRGRFDKFDGQIHMVPGELSTLQAEVNIDAKSINTDEKQRDEHLRTNDFLDAPTYPNITFESTGVRDVSGESFKLEGELTIRGVTEPVVLDATYLGEGKDPWGGTRVGFSGVTTVNRKDFEVNWNTALEAGGFLVGDEVTIELDVQAVLDEEKE